MSRKTAFEFKALFTIVHENLRARNAASGGEEMLRLRAYEKLQNLVQGGIVKKVGKTYRGIGPALVTFFETAAEMNAKFASGNHSRAPMSAAVPEAVEVAVPVVAKKPAVAKARGEAKKPALAKAKPAAKSAPKSKALASKKPVAAKAAVKKPATRRVKELSSKE